MAVAYGPDPEEIILLKTLKQAFHVQGFVDICRSGINECGLQIGSPALRRAAEMGDHLFEQIQIKDRGVMPHLPKVSTT
jgi:hypothetical protein